MKNNPFLWLWKVCGLYKKPNIPPKDVMIKNPERFIAPLAEWWADRIFTTEPNWDNGGLLQTVFMANATANIKTEALGKREAFVGEFSERLRQYIAENDKFPDLYIDYNPPRFLSDIAEKLGIHRSVFPCKAGTEYDPKDDKIYGKNGYQAEWLPIA